MRSIVRLTAAGREGNSLQQTHQSHMQVGQPQGMQGQCSLPLDPSHYMGHICICVGVTVV